MHGTTKAVAGFLGLAIWCGADFAAAGTIKGIVRLAGGPVEVKKLKVTVDHNTCGTTKDAEDLVVSSDMGLPNVVVLLVTPPSDGKLRVMRHIQMDQRQGLLGRDVLHVLVDGKG